MDLLVILKKIKEKLKPKFQKLMKILLVLVILAALVLAGIFLLTRIRNVSYVGNAPYTAEEVKAKCGSVIGRNIFFADLDKLTDELEKSLPYLNNVTVSKRLPWTIKVDGDQSLKTYAVVVSKGSYAITNNNVKVLENTNQITNNLIYVVRNDGFWTYAVGEKISFLPDEQKNNEKGEKNTDHIQEFLSQLPDAMEETGLRNIGMVLVDSSTDISMVYQNRILIRMGDSSDIFEKIKVALKIIADEDEIQNTQCGILNVMYTGKGVFSPADYADIPELEQLAEIQQEQQELADLIQKQQTETEKHESEPVTDENGEPVTDENGEQVTELVTDESEDHAGDKTDVETTASGEETTKAESTGTTVSDTLTTTEKN